MKRKYSEHFKQ